MIKPSNKNLTEILPGANPNVSERNIVLEPSRLAVVKRVDVISLNERKRLLHHNNCLFRGLFSVFVRLFCWHRISSCCWTCRRSGPLPPTGAWLSSCIGRQSLQAHSQGFPAYSEASE